MHKTVVIALLSLLLLSGCDLFKYHPYQGEFDGEEHLTQQNLDWLVQRPLGSPIRFAFLSDTQRRYDDTDDAVKAINARGDIDFVLHGGDLTDFGLTEEFVWMRDCLMGLQMPWFTVIGNHDFLGHGEHIYDQMFGALNYAFTAGNTRFEMLNTVALELDYSTPVPDFSFLERELKYLEEVNRMKADSIRRTIFVMHSRPGDEQFNNNVLLPFDRYLRLFPGMDSLQHAKPLPSFCLNGHCHYSDVIEPYEDGILFYSIASIKSRCYYLFTLNPDDSYDVEEISF